MVTNPRPESYSQWIADHLYELARKIEEGEEICIELSTSEELGPRGFVENLTITTLTKEQEPPLPPRAGKPEWERLPGGVFMSGREYAEMMRKMLLEGEDDGIEPGIGYRGHHLPHAPKKCEHPFCPTEYCEYDNVERVRQRLLENKR